MSTLSDIVGMIYDPNSREGEAVREDWRKAIRYIRDNNFKVLFRRRMFTCNADYYDALLRIDRVTWLVTALALTK